MDYITFYVQKTFLKKMSKDDCNKLKLTSILY